MPPSTTKKVMLYRWERPPVDGIIDPADYLRDGRIEWITPDGHLQVCPLSDCKALCFVSDTAKPDLFTDANLFERRPRVPGLWTRFAFRDGAVLEGVLSHNLIDWPESGYFAIPPQARAARQRVFIPKLALMKTELRGVVGGSSLQVSRRLPVTAASADPQIDLFDG